MGFLNKTNVAGYIRVSTEKQKQEGAHDRQREKLLEWSELQDEELDVTIFEDAGISGQDDSREEYQEMMDRLEEFDMVVVRELSRLGRDMSQLLDDVQEMEEVGVEFVSLRENIDTSSAQGQLIFNIFGAIAQFKSDLARERALEDVQRRRENGERVGRPPKLDEEEAEELVEMREEHDPPISWSDLGKIFGVSRTTARRTYQRLTEKQE